MNRQQARNLIKSTFEGRFDADRFSAFIKNLLNHFDGASFHYHGNYIPDAYKPFIRSYRRMGKYSDGENRMDILVVYLNKETSIEHARTSQRNFIAGYLSGQYGSTASKEAALVAFVAPDEADWRFSLVKMDTALMKMAKSKRHSPRPGVGLFWWVKTRAATPHKRSLSPFLKRMITIRP